MSVKRKLSNTEISSFCDQTALILSAGITPVEGMRILLSDTEDAQGRKIISEILEICERGEPFSKALAHTGVFPDYAVNMVTVGEESGKTDEVMRALSEYYAKEEMIADSLKARYAIP